MGAQYHRDCSLGARCCGGFAAVEKGLWFSIAGQSQAVRHRAGLCLLLSYPPAAHLLNARPGWPFYVTRLGRVFGPILTRLQRKYFGPEYVAGSWVSR